MFISLMMNYINIIFYKKINIFQNLINYVSYLIKYLIMNYINI